jgi:hypothetical protein
MSAFNCSRMASCGQAGNSNMKPLARSCVLATQRPPYVRRLRAGHAFCLPCFVKQTTESEMS